MEERPDGLIIHGPTPLKGAALSSFDDHRIAMAFAVAGLIAKGETVIEGAEAVAISFPTFWETLAALSAVRDRVRRRARLRSEAGAYVNPFMYVAVRTLAWFLFRTFWRLKVRGLENVPMSGPLIVAPNHRSYADPPLVGVAVPRPVYFLAKKELFSFPPFGWFIRQLNAHPLNRAGDIAAFREAARILKAGGGIIIFPEGRRIDGDTFGEAKAGLGMLASTTGAKILPVYIHDSARMTRFSRVEITFGKPLDPDGFSSYGDIAARVMTEIAALRSARGT